MLDEHQRLFILADFLFEGLLFLGQSGGLIPYPFDFAVRRFRRQAKRIFGILELGVDITGLPGRGYPAPDRRAFSGKRHRCFPRSSN